MADPIVSVAGSLTDAHASVVIIWRCGQHIEVQPPGLEMSELLQTLNVAAEYPAGKGPRVRLRRIPMYECGEDADGNPVLICRAGLEPIIRQLLERAGTPYRVVGRRCDPLPLPDIANLRRFDVTDNYFLEAVAEREQTLVRLNRRTVKVERLIAQVAHAWPSATLVVAVKSSDRVRDLTSLLRSWGLPVRSVVTASDWNEVGPMPRIVVTLFRGLGGSVDEIEKRDFVIVPDAVQMLGQLERERLRRAQRARLIGLLDAGERLAPYERDALLAFFGTPLELPCHGGCPQPIQVGWMNIKGRAMDQTHRHLLAIKRQCIWWHNRRNRRITRLARALRSGDQDLLRRLVPELAECLRDRMPARTLILVEGLEHALALAQRLDGWPVLVGPDVTPDGLSARHRELLQSRTDWDDQTPMAVIVTSTGLRDLLAPVFDVVIRADGGIGLPPLPASWLVTGQDANRQLVIVDCDDHHHPELRQRSRRREHAYAQAGWSPVGLGRSYPELAQFLAERPWAHTRWRSSQ